MKIAFYLGKIQKEDIGGTSTFQMALLDGLKNANEKNEIYFYYRSKIELFKNNNNSLIKFINTRPSAWDAVVKRDIKILDFYLKRDNIDLVYFLSPFDYQDVSIPYILTVWDLSYKSVGIFPEFISCYNKREILFKKAISNASFIVIGNRVGKEEICKFYNFDEKRIKIIPMPTPDYIFTNKINDSILDKYELRNSKYLFYPAIFWAHKNHIRLVKAMKKLKKQGFKLVFTGTNDFVKEYIENKIKEYDLEKDVLILGFVTKEEIIALYKNSWCLAYASFLGPDNIPPLEAMALEVPVICSDIEGMREQLGDCALFFNPVDENDFVEKIEQLKDENLRNDLIRKGKALADNCGIKNYVSKIFAIIDDFEKYRECWE